MANRTISKKRFEQLKAGDLVLWRGYRLRTIQEGPGDGKGKALCITFSKLRSSWTKHGCTVYTFHDVSRLIRPVGKRVRGLLLKSELAALKEIGFDAREEILREIRLADRLDRPKCRAYKRLLRLAEKSQI